MSALQECASHTFCTINMTNGKKTKQVPNFRCGKRASVRGLCRVNPYYSCRHTLCIQATHTHLCAISTSLQPASWWCHPHGPRIGPGIFMRTFARPLRLRAPPERARLFLPRPNSGRSSVFRPEWETCWASEELRSGLTQSFFPQALYSSPLNSRITIYLQHGLQRCWLNNTLLHLWRTGIGFPLDPEFLETSPMWISHDTETIKLSFTCIHSI